MKSHSTANRPDLRAFISAKAVIVIAVITLGTGLLAYEWRHAHGEKIHGTSVSEHHHHKKKESKTAVNP